MSTVQTQSTSYPWNWKHVATARDMETAQTLIQFSSSAQPSQVSEMANSNSDTLQAAEALLLLSSSSVPPACVKPFEAQTTHDVFTPTSPSSVSRPALPSMSAYELQAAANLAKLKQWANPADFTTSPQSVPSFRAGGNILRAPTKRSKRIAMRSRQRLPCTSPCCIGCQKTTLKRKRDCSASTSEAPSAKKVKCADAANLSVKVTPTIRAVPRAAKNLKMEQSMQPSITSSPVYTVSRKSELKMVFQLQDVQSEICPAHQHQDLYMESLRKREYAEVSSTAKRVRFEV